MYVYTNRFSTVWKWNLTQLFPPSCRIIHQLFRQQQKEKLKKNLRVCRKKFFIFSILIVWGRASEENGRGPGALEEDGAESRNFAW